MAGTGIARCYRYSEVLQLWQLTDNHQERAAQFRVDNGQLLQLSFLPDHLLDRAEVGHRLGFWADIDYKLSQVSHGTAVRWRS